MTPDQKTEQDPLPPPTLALTYDDKTCDLSILFTRVGLAEFLSHPDLLRYTDPGTGVTVKIFNDSDFPTMSQTELPVSFHPETLCFSIDIQAKAAERLRRKGLIGTRYSGPGGSNKVTIKVDDEQVELLTLMQGQRPGFTSP